MSDQSKTTGDRIARAWGLLPDGWSISPPPDATVLELSSFDLDRVRQWFNAVQDATPRYLEQRDYELAVRVHRALFLPVPLSVARHLKDAESHD